jgi:hypothetical protein
MKILASLGGAANGWSEAEGTPMKPHAGAGEGDLPGYLIRRFCLPESKAV